MSLNDYIGEEYEVISLKPLSKRFLNKRRSKTSRQPYVQLLTTRSGRKFKRLYVDDPGNKHFLRIAANISLFRYHNFIPDVVWNDECNLIVKYIEGIFPEFSTSRFAELYGRNLALLIKKDLEFVSSDQVIEETLASCRYILDNKVINKSLYTKIVNYFIDSSPAQVAISSVYADQKHGNFVLATDGHLFFIDLGSFAKRTIVDQFFWSGNIKDKIKLNCFKKHFLREGGPAFFFDESRFVSLISYISIIVARQRQLVQLPIYSYRMRRARKRWIEQYTEKIKYYLS